MHVEDRRRGGHESDTAHTLDHDEVFMALSGSIELSGDPLGPGDAVVVPAGGDIALSNRGGTPAEVVVAVPAGFTATMAEGTPAGTPPWGK